jgi:hypothetical protein
MTADLKAVAQRVRTTRPELFKVQEFKDPQQDGDGKITIVVRKDSKANPLTRTARHALAFKKD